MPTGVVGPQTGRYTSFRPFLVNGAGYGGPVGTVADAARLAMVTMTNTTTAWDVDRQSRLIEDIEKNGEATTQEEAQKRPVPDFEACP